MISGLSLFDGDDRIGAPGMQAKGLFRDNSADNRPAIKGIGPAAPSNGWALHVDSFKGAFNL